MTILAIALLVGQLSEHYARGNGNDEIFTTEPAAALSADPPPPVSEIKPKVHSFQYLVSHSAESGTTDRVQLEYYGRFRLHSNFDIETGGRFSFIDHWGPTLIGLTGILKAQTIRSEIGLGLQYERWPSWQVTENRAVVYWLFYGFSGLETLLGASYRSPQFKSIYPFQSFAWTGNTDEIGPIYRIRTYLLSINNLKFSLQVWNYDLMRVFTYDDIQFSLRPELTLSETFSIFCLVGTASKGVSGAVLSWGQNTFILGVHHEF